MPEVKAQAEKGVATTAAAPIRNRMLEFAARAWRPAGTVVVVTLALLLTWHVVEGKHGLSVWQQKRAEDQQLRKQIDDLRGENERLRHHVEHLKSDPQAIGHEAREKLHYAKPNEVIVTLPPPPSEAQPPQPQSDAQPRPK
jgi:cell division protein FtsB